MALTGSFTHYIYTDTSESIEETIVYPADLPESHVDYPKRGTTEVVSGSAQIIEEEVYEGVYIAIKSTNIWKTVDQGGDPENLLLTANYRVYGNEASRSADVNNYIIELDAVVKNWDWDSDTNPYSSTYDYIKTLPGNNLVDC